MKDIPLLSSTFNLTFYFPYMFYNRFNYFSQGCYDISVEGVVPAPLTCTIKNNYIKIFNLATSTYSNLTGFLINYTFRIYKY